MSTQTVTSHRKLSGSFKRPGAVYSGWLFVDLWGSSTSLDTFRSFGVPGHRSSTPKFVTPTALSCIDNSWRSTTLSLPKKLTSSTANLEWCHFHFIRDSYSTFIRRVIGPSKNSMELFCKAKFDFKSTWNRDSATSHHKHPVCQSPAGDAEKLTNVWSRYFGTNRIIDNWHRCLGVMWRKRKKYFDK